MLKTGMLGRVVCLLLVAGLSAELYADSSAVLKVPPPKLVQPSLDHIDQPILQDTKAGWRADETIAIDFNSRASRTIHVPGASFIKIHFSRFSLPQGVYLEVSSPSGFEHYRYSSKWKDPITVDSAAGDDGMSRFSAMSVSGDTIVIRLVGDAKVFTSAKFQVVIDHYMVGFPLGSGNSDYIGAGNANSSIQADPGTSKNTIKTQCGLDDRVDAICTNSSNPAEYGTSRAVARLLINGTQNCTAWRVGSGNHMLTNYHCIGSQAVLASTEIWFNYEHTLCGGTGLEQEIKITGAQLIASNSTLDYALFSVDDFSLISSFGHLGLEVGDGELGDLIYIPQHGNGLPKQMAMASDMDISGLCEISDTDHTGYAWSTDLGYFCDTVGGSSGAPVLLRDNNKVVALHHFGGCVNSGVKMSLIWPELSPHFGGVVPVGGEGGPSGNTPPAANFNPDCTGLNCAFNGSGSVDPDGQIVSYSWNFGDGGSASGVQVNHSFAVPGSYQVSLFVEDNEGAVDTEIQTISVAVLNNSPVAAYSFSCNDRLCDFNAGLSSDGDGQIVSYHWDFGDGSSAQSASPLVQHAFTVDGQYTVRLTVWDDDGASGQAQSTIEVTTAIVNLEPVAEYSYSCTDLACEFDASSSSDPDGTITAYAWDFDEGESVETGGPIKNHIFSGPGDYTVSLEVEDNMGAVSSYAVTISVALPPPANIELSVMAYKQRGSKRVILSWSGASGSSVSIFKDGEFLSGVLNDGEFTDFNVPIKARSLSYQVCETDLSLCSQIVVANF